MTYIRVDNIENHLENLSVGDIIYIHTFRLALFLISCNCPFKRAIIQLSNCPLEVKCIMFSANTS